jgi:hypothetical protein
MKNLFVNGVSADTGTLLDGIDIVFMRIPENLW